MSIDVGTVWGYKGRSLVGGSKRAIVEEIDGDMVTMGFLPKSDNSMHMRLLKHVFPSEFVPAANPEPCAQQVWSAYELIPKWGLHKVKLTIHDDAKKAWKWEPIFEPGFANSLGITGGWIWDTSFSKLAEVEFISGPMKVDLKRFPHFCPRCNERAYVGGGPSSVDCSNAKCPTKGLTIRI